MSFEYIIEKDNTSKTLSKENENSLVKMISDDFKTFNDKRSTSLDKANTLIDEIFFKKSFINKSSDKNTNWKSKIKMCKVFMLYQTLKAFIWRNVYSNVNSMFDVSGENQDSDNDSNKQKAMLVDILEKMNYQKTCDTVIDNALLYGELISFTAWKKKYEEYRRPIDFFKNLFSGNVEKLPKILEAIKQGKNFWIDTRKIYDNPYIYPVNPANLVFDVSQKDNWDECPKIYRSFKTPQEIINNQLYKVDKPTAEAIKSIVKSSKDTSGINKDIKRLFDDVTDGETIEILEHWGDLKLPDGTLLKNWHAVVVARKFLVRFQKNETIINPFTYGTFLLDPETKRGISPLYSILSIAHAQEDLFNRTLNMQALSENPPLLTPEGFFSQEEINLYPGKIIEYGDNLSPTAAFKQLQFEHTVFLNDITFLDSLMSEVSGIYPSMIGTEEASTKTATEITTKTQGQMTRLSMLLDIINQYLIIPDVKNVAKLCADFKSGVETVFVNKNNQKEMIEVDDTVRQADYKYTYADRTMINEKSSKADLLIQAIDKFSQKISLDLPEIFIWYFEQKGVENPERFLGQQAQLGAQTDAVNPMQMIAAAAAMQQQNNPDVNAAQNAQNTTQQPIQEQQ